MQVILSHDESYKSQKSIIFNATMFHEFVVQKKKEKTAFIDQRAVAAGKNCTYRPACCAAGKNVSELARRWNNQIEVNPTKSKNNHLQRTILV